MTAQLSMESGLKAKGHAEKIKRKVAAGILGSSFRNSGNYNVCAPCSSWQQKGLTPHIQYL